MKKLILLIVLLFQLTFVFGQERDEVGHRVTPWVIARHGCFTGLEWKVRKSYYSDNSDNFINEIEIKNKYSSKITFSFDVSADSNAKTTQSRKTLNPEEITRFTRVQNVDFVYLYIADVCFNSDNRCTGTCYALCDNGIPNIPTDCGEQKSNSNNNSAGQATNANTSTSQQNDLSDYNRSKEDLERQIAEKNAEGQQKSQNYTAAMNAGISAHNSGNYNEAKRQFSIALNNCNTEEARQKAQEYYDKSVSAEKNQAKLQTINALGNVALDLAKNIKVRKWDNGNLVGDNDLFNDFTKDVIIELEKIGVLYSHLYDKYEQEYIKNVGQNGEVNERSRQLYFYYKDKDLLTVNIKSRFFPTGNGTYFFIEPDFKNSAITELLKEKKPFKKFKSATSQSGNGYPLGIRMINYTSRINQNDVEIFKQDNWVDEALSKLETTVPNNIFDNPTKYQGKIIPTPNIKFNLSQFNHDNSVNVVVVNGSFGWCPPCKEVFNKFTDIENPINSQFIQLQFNEDDKEFDKTSTIYNNSKNVYFIDNDEFDITQLNQDRTVPLIYIYKGNVLKKSFVGISNFQEILKSIKELSQ